MNDSFVRIVGRLNRLLHARLCRRIEAHLQANREPATAAELAGTLNVSLYVARRALRSMQRDGKVAVVGVSPQEGRAYRPVEIGLCEWCGLLDHHLVAGECPACAATVPEIARPAHARSVC